MCLRPQRGPHRSDASGGKGHSSVEAADGYATSHGTGTSLPETKSSFERLRSGLFERRFMADHGPMRDMAT
ncbi:protein of unknown function [Burkholderia multivorans]